MIFSTAGTNSGSATGISPWHVCRQDNNYKWFPNHEVGVGIHLVKGPDGCYWAGWQVQEPLINFSNNFLIEPKGPFKTRAEAFKWARSKVIARTFGTDDLPEDIAKFLRDIEEHEQLSKRGADELTAILKRTSANAA